MPFPAPPSSAGRGRIWAPHPAQPSYPPRFTRMLTAYPARPPVPTAAPRNVVVHGATATQLDVTWEPPPLDSHNGDIQGYKVGCPRAEQRGAWTRGQVGGWGVSHMWEACRSPGPPFIQPAPAALAIWTLRRNIVHLKLNHIHPLQRPDGRLSLGAKTLAIPQLIPSLSSTHIPPHQPPAPYIT